MKEEVWCIGKYSQSKKVQILHFLITLSQISIFPGSIYQSFLDYVNIILQIVMYAFKFIFLIKVGDPCISQTVNAYK